MTLSSMQGTHMWLMELGLSDCPALHYEVLPQLINLPILRTFLSPLLEGSVQNLNKQILITETGLDIVCGPQGELCVCYRNGFQLGFTQQEVADLDFVSCWLVEEDSVPTAPAVRNMACAGRDQPRLSSRAWARRH